jgi:hypothetical protein
VKDNEVMILLPHIHPADRKSDEHTSYFPVIAIPMYFIGRSNPHNQTYLWKSSLCGLLRQFPHFVRDKPRNDGGSFY